MNDYSKNPNTPGRKPPPTGKKETKMNDDDDLLAEEVYHHNNTKAERERLKGYLDRRDEELLCTRRERDRLREGIKKAIAFLPRSHHSTVVLQHLRALLDEKGISDE